MFGRKMRAPSRCNHQIVGHLALGGSLGHFFLHLLATQAANISEIKSYNVVWLRGCRSDI